MENLFDAASATKILNRLDRLPPDATQRWGKMNVAQMLAHCQAPLKVALGELQLNHSLFGKLFGGIAKKQMLKPGPFKQNLPTAPQFKVIDQRNFESEKVALKLLIQRFATADVNSIVARKHPFFGSMTSDEWGILQWKHLDHHLTQFGV